MTFCEQLNKYIEQLDCSSQELANVSGLSSTVISRYRNGDRTPRIKSKQLEHLADGLYKISCKNNINIKREEIYFNLSNTLNDISINFEQLSKNLNELVSTLNINIAKLSRFIGYDASFVSKIRTGNIKPSKPQDFIEAVCNFVVEKFNSDDDKKTVSLLIDCPVEELKDNKTYLSKLITWFSTNTTPTPDYINNFLKNLDEFDLNQYIKAIHFDEMKVPFVPFYKSTSKSYYGIEEMKKGKLDFFKSTVLSKSTDPVFMCSDMPMEDMAKDVEFGKKWMFAIAMTLKKGLHLNIIHNLDRPFNEMMLGLESWIPIYMTGQVSPFYLKGFQDSVYCHLNYVSGSTALTGECINGYHKNGKYSLTSNKSEVSYYRKKTELLLKKAQPLMEIYRYDSKNSFNVFLESSSKEKGNRRRILSSLPIHTISDELLLKILRRNKIPDNDIQNILSAVKEQKKLMDIVLSSSIFKDEISEISKKDFHNNTPTLSLSDSFYENKINYTYDEYLEHLKLTKDFEKNNINYKLITNTTNIFKNIQILICENKWVMISKDSSPSIHFVIKHPKLRDAIENFVPLIVEKDIENDIKD